MRIASIVTPLVLAAASITAQEPAASVADWSIRVATDGGLSGTGRNNVVLTSAGELTCTGGTDRCDGKVSGSVVTTMTLRTHAGGERRTYVARWDDSQAVPPAVRALLATLAALRRGK